MTVWVYGLMWNEAVMLPHYLRHYGAIADRIIIYDHRSNDGSREAAIAAGAEVRDYSAWGIDEPQVTALYNSCYREARGQADWVILADIDEFVYHPQIRQLLDDYQAAGVTFPRIQGYTMLHDEPPAAEDNILACRFGIPDDMFSKRVVFKPALDVHYDHGRHTCSAFGDAVEMPEAEIKLLHYRWWGEVWTRRRHMSHYYRLSEISRLHGWGTHKLPDACGYYSIPWFREAYTRRAEVI
jgi:hypothetical protein